MGAFTRSHWNDLLDEVNEILENPPEDSECDPIDPIEHVPAMHRWAKSDIREVQDKLKETCEDITFDDVANLWKQSTLDEIRSKFDQAWCDCECDEQPAKDQHGTVFFIRENPSTVVSECFGNVGSIPICDLIAGMQIGLPGYDNRRWVFRFQRIGKDNFPRTLANGDIDCDGVVVCTTSQTIPIAGGDGIFVGCSNCESSSCQSTLAKAQAKIDAGIADGSKASSIVYDLFLSSSSAVCCE